MVIPQPMGQKNPDFEPLSPIYGQNTGLRALAVGLMPSNLPRGGFGDLAVFGRFGVKNDPKKKVSKCVWGYFGVVFMMFPVGFDAFWALQTTICVSDRLA